MHKYINLLINISNLIDFYNKMLNFIILRVFNIS
jgi:hypothetical protein